MKKEIHSKHPNDAKALRIIKTFFITSNDFNGISGVQLSSELKKTSNQTREVLHRLISKKDIDIAFAKHQSNPHIKRIDTLPSEQQLKMLREEEPTTFCIYPSKKHLTSRCDITKYKDKPFTSRLMLGDAQLTPLYFELGVLERYYRDPRFNFKFNDFGGSISINDESYNSNTVLERDKILLQSFGIAYDTNRNRVIVAFLRYLSDLSPEHQQIWQAHIVESSCVMNSDYERASLYGVWPIHHSAYRALITEIDEINKLATIIGKPILFRESFMENIPSGFHPMLRPTMRNFREFVFLLDKMLSENINRDFFRGDIVLEKESVRSDGKIQVQQIGAINLLRDWLRHMYRTSEGKDISEEAIKPIKRVREQRQLPAHSIQEDEFNLVLPAQQDKLVADVIGALSKLRCVFMSHPKARGNYEPPKWFDSDKIVFY